MSRRGATTTGALVLLGLSLGLLGLSGCGRTAAAPTAAARAHGGVLDLRAWDPELDGPAELAGEWRFEWHVLREPGEPLSPDASLVELPSSWDDYEVDGEKVGGLGFATYSLTVLLGPRERALSLLVPRTRTATALWINGVERMRMGRTGVDRESSRPLRRALIVAVEGAERLEMVLQVSNFHFRSGGPDKVLELGTVEQHLAPRFAGALYSTLFIGCFVMLGCYHLMLSVARRGSNEPVVFAVLCFLVACYVLTRENELFGLLLPFVSWTVELRVEYTLYGVLVPLTAYFFRLLYPREATALLVRSCVAVSALFVAGTWALPTTVASDRWILVYQVFVLIAGVYGLERFVVAYRRRRPGSGWFLAGFAAFLGAGLIDGLLARFVPGLPRMLPLGFILFAVAQSLMLAKAMAESVSRAELLSARLFALASAHQALEQEAFRDPLTGLENRRRLDRGFDSLAEVDREEQEARTEWVSLLYLDLDRFKEVNDRFGHQVGDQVLRHVGSAIREEVRDSDVSVRMGGDEFVVLLRDTTAAAADRLAERLRARLREPFTVDGRRLSISASIGRATSTASRVDLAALLRRADRAMYREKARDRVTA